MLKYPKKTEKKKRRKHRLSILHPDDGTCYLCWKLNHDFHIRNYLEVHHVFGGPNRRISEEYGFFYSTGMGWKGPKTDKYNDQRIHGAGNQKGNHGSRLHNLFYQGGR